VINFILSELKDRMSINLPINIICTHGLMPRSLLLKDTPFEVGIYMRAFVRARVCVCRQRQTTHYHNTKHRLSYLWNCSLLRPIKVIFSSAARCGDSTLYA
jgi:hypothetical protein